MPISEIVATVANVNCFKNGQSQASASGFFYEHSGKLFFITNRHVVIHEEEDYFPDEARLKLHTNPNNIRENQDYSIHLYENNNCRWLEHPQGRQQIDVVALPLDVNITSRFFIKAFSEPSHIPPDVDIAIGEDVLVIGYPLGFHDNLHNLPIVRNAVMASVYPVPFNGKPMILIDSRLHSGTSGSPVITKPTNIIRHTNGSTSMSNITQTFLVGIHSASFDIKGRDPNRDEPLGLNAVWFASLIPQIITQVV